jgi:hypothetical protein
VPPRISEIAAQGDLFPQAVSLAEQIAELDRELRLRSYVYARQVFEGRLSEDTARLRLMRLRAAVHTLRLLERSGGLPDDIA